MRNNRQSVKGKKTAATRKGSKPKSRDPRSFVEAITSESWTTPSAFEDLCLLMLSELLERPFRRARAGFQEGRDLDSDLGSIVTHVECKRYSGKLKDREIVGELAQSIVKTPSLEVYVLCATTAVHAQLAAQMRQVADPHLIEVVFLDCKEPVSSLALCFAATQSWRNMEGAAWGRLEKITQELDELKAHPSAEDLLVNIYDTLSGISAGLAGVRQTIASGLRDVFRSDGNSRAAFGQPLAVLAEGTRIERPTVDNQLSRWLANWPSTMRPALVMGNEGVGKTWSLAAWISGNLDRLPPVLFITRIDMISLNLFKVLAAALRKWASGPTEDVWESWVIRRLSDRRMSPSLTVVFDGLNERPSAQWQELLQQAIAKAPKIQVIVTTRPRFAETRLAYSGPPSSANEGWCLQGQPHGIQVDPFDDSELASALSQVGVEDYKLPSSVLDLIRVPRYFRIAVEHLAAVSDYGSEITVERLLFHDFRNRVSLGRFSLVRSMPDYKWQEALERLTVEKRDQIHRPEGGLRRILREREIEDILSEDNRLDADDIETCLSEITEGKLFKNLGRGRYEAEPRLVQYALGALLFEEVVEKLEFGWSAAEQRLAEFCDPLAGLDFLASIVGTAAAIALLSADKCPEQAKTLLLVTWADIQNADITALFAAYARTAPKTYLEVAELLDRRGALRGQSGDFILDALLRLRDVPDFQHPLMEHFLSWIGWDKRIFTYGLSKATTFESVRSTFGLDIPDGTANQSGELRRIAMTVIGSGPQLPWLNVFLASCFTAVSRRNMRSLSDVTWIVRLNRHDPIEAHTALRLTAQKLSKIPGAFCDAVGCVLLAIVGGSADQNRINSNYRNELRSLNIAGATELIAAVSGEKRIDETLGWIDPTKEFPRVPASATNEIVTFGDFVRSARESPAAISRIQPFIVKFLDSYLRSDSERITFPQALNWQLPAIVTAPLVQTNIKEIELKLDELAQRLNTLGISYTTIDRLQYFVELVFGLSPASKRQQLRSSWAQFDLDRIAADENWGRLARGFAADAELENSPDPRKRAGALKDFKFGTIVATDSQEMAAGHIAEYLNNWDHMTSRSKSVLLAALNSNVQSVDLKALAKKWSWVDSVAKEEQVYGALLLARNQTLSIETLTTNLPPIFWATAAMAREHTDENLMQWKRAFDSWITRSETNPIFDVATSLTLRTLEGRGDRRKASDVVGHNLQFLSILSEGKGRGLGGWIKTVREQPTRARGEFVRFMHCMLTRSLMTFDLKLARSLWRSFFDSGQEQLAPVRHSRDLIHGLTSSIPLSEDEWLQSALDLYDNDLSLFELALNCSADATKRDWLTGVIARDRSSSVDWRMARGNVLAGFALVDVGRNFIGKAKGGWAETTAAMAEVWHLRNKYSAVWYGRYLREPGTIKAVANLALHLASVDARARIWREKAEEGAFENRLQHAILYAHSISEFETDNARRLQETYLGWPRSDAR